MSIHFEKIDNYIFSVMINNQSRTVDYAVIYMMKDGIILILNIKRRGDLIMAVNTEENYAKYKLLPEDEQKQLEEILNQMFETFEEVEEDLTDEEMAELRWFEENFDSVEGTPIEDIDWTK